MNGNTRLRINQWPPKDKSGVNGNDPGVFYKVVKKIGESLLYLLYQPKVENSWLIEYMNKTKKGFVFVGNHDSGIDPLYFTKYFKSKIHTIAVDNPHWNSKSVRYLLRNLGVIAAIPDGSGGETLKVAIKAIQHRFTVMIFPEANFYHHRRKIYGRTGAAVVLATTGCPALLFGIRGIDERIWNTVIPPLRRHPIVKFVPPRLVRDEYLISEGEVLDPDVARGITDELMYDIRKASNFAGLTKEHRNTLLDYYKNFETNKFTYQDPNAIDQDL